MLFLRRLDRRRYVSLPSQKMEERRDFNYAKEPNSLLCLKVTSTINRAFKSLQSWLSVMSKYGSSV